MAKLSQPPDPNEQQGAAEIAKLWEGINKQNMTQYKLKVDLNADVRQLIDRDPAKIAAGGVAPELMTNARGSTN